MQEKSRRGLDQRLTPGQFSRQSLPSVSAAYTVVAEGFFSRLRSRGAEKMKGRDRLTCLSSVENSPPRLRGIRKNLVMFRQDFLLRARGADENSCGSRLVNSAARQKNDTQEIRAF